MRHSASCRGRHGNQHAHLARRNWDESPRPRCAHVAASLTHCWPPTVLIGRHSGQTVLKGAPTSSPPSGCRSMHSVGPRAPNPVLRFRGVPPAAPTRKYLAPQRSCRHRAAWRTFQTHTPRGPPRKRRRRNCVHHRLSDSRADLAPMPSMYCGSSPPHGRRTDMRRSRCRPRRCCSGHSALLEH